MQNPTDNELLDNQTAKLVVLGSKLTIYRNVQINK